MHIITGIIVSALLGGKKKKGFRGFRGVVEVLHIIPGRVRFSVPSIRDNEDACHQLLDARQMPISTRPGPKVRDVPGSVRVDARRAAARRR